MAVLKAINSAMVDLFHLLFAPLQDGQDRDTAIAFPVWARAAVAWAIVGGFMVALILSL
jgi:hypothetical protein